MILIIGYGNPLRGDDAVGQYIARLMEQRLRHETTAVITAYQLTPELIEPVSYADMIIFIDARVGATPGMIFCENVVPEVEANAFTHNVSPGTLLGAARELYGTTPDGILISIVGLSFDYSSELSPELSRILPDKANEIEAIIEANTKIYLQQKSHHARA